MSLDDLVVVSMTPARNEEQYLSNSLFALKNQTKKVSYSVVVNDGSTDHTSEIAKSFGVDVVELEDRGYNVYDKRLGSVVNAGILKATEKKYDYILLIGPDTVMPLNYVELMISRMERDDIALASGIIGADNYENVRGSGRVIRRDLLDEIGGCYPSGEMWESYILYYVVYSKYKYAVYDDLVLDHERETGQNYTLENSHLKGIIYRSLGLTFKQKLIMNYYYLLKKRNLKAYFIFWYAYYFKSESKYPDHVRLNFRKTWGNKSLSQFLRR